MIFLQIVSLILASAPVLGGDPGTLSPERQSAVLRAALSAFDEAVAASPSNPKKAQEFYRRAAAGFQALVDSGIRNAGLEYNLGNTEFRLGQLGQAVLHYRRAERLDPGDAKLRANLAYARRQVEPLIPVGGEAQLRHRLLFWHYDTSLAQRFLAAAILAGLGWMLLILRMRYRTRPILAVGLVCIVLGLACSASVAWQIHDESQSPAAVVVDGGQTLRLGRGAAYEPALKQPLGPGVELRVLQQRGDWVEVRLANGQTGWLPAAAVAQV
jgi:tetratricopeptide (TPR) repeat protein